MGWAGDPPLTLVYEYQDGESSKRERYNTVTFSITLGMCPNGAAEQAPAHWAAVSVGSSLDDFDSTTGKTHIYSTDHIASWPVSACVLG